MSPAVPAEGWARRGRSVSPGDVVATSGARRYWAHMAMPMARAAPTRMSWLRVSVPS